MPLLMRLDIYFAILAALLVLECTGLYSTICSERIVRVADYNTVFQTGITAYDAGDVETARDCFICVTRSPDFRHKGYLRLGILHKELEINDSSARLLLLKALQNNQITLAEEVLAIRELIELYKKSSMLLHIQFYEELLEVLSDDIDLKPRVVSQSLRNRPRNLIEDFFSCSDVEKFADGSLSLLAVYLGKRYLTAAHIVIYIIE